MTFKRILLSTDISGSSSFAELTLARLRVFARKVISPRTGTFSIYREIKLLMLFDGKW